MGNSRDDLDDGCECPRGILAPYGGAIGASQRVNFLWDETLSLPHVLCWPTSTGQQQTDSGSMSIDILTGIWQGVILASWRQPVVRW